MLADRAYHGRRLVLLLLLAWRLVAAHHVGLRAGDVVWRGWLPGRHIHDVVRGESVGRRRKWRLTTCEVDHIAFAEVVEC